MKILFIINMEDLGFEEPLGVMYLSAMCKHHGHDVYAVNNNVSRIVEKILAVKPDMLALSVLTPSFSYLLDSVKKVKHKFDIPTVFGGPHVTFFPEEMLATSEIDYIFRGESEEAFVQFLDLLQEGKPLDNVPNLVARDPGGKLRENPLHPLNPDLDVLPFPDRELFADYPQFYRSDVKSAIASRGCPYNCSYCFNEMIHKMYRGLGKIVRLRSVDNIIAECIVLKENYHAKIIHFFDDIFPYRKDWLAEFAQKYPRRVGLPFFTNTRFTVCTEDYVRSLSRAGCKTLLVGVESGNPEVREKVLNRKMSNEMMVEKAELIHKYGIKIYTQNIIGLPHGSFEKDLETLRLNIAMKADFSGAYLCQPYPKTKIAKIATAAGLLGRSYEIGRSFYYSSPLNLPDKERIEKLRIIFAIIVNFPFFYAHTDRLLQMPEFMVRFASSLLHGYKIKTTVLRYRMGIKEFIKNIRLFFSRRINSAFDPDKVIDKL